jgi:hypothetical protein
MITMSAVSWLYANKDWIFSGIGVAALAAILGRLFQRRHKPTDEGETMWAEPIFPLLVSAPTPVPTHWKLIEKLPGLRTMAQQRIYSEERIGQAIRIWIRSEGDGINISKNGDGGVVRAHLDVINLNPFPLLLDRFTGDVTVSGSPVAKINVIDRHQVPAVSWADVYFESTLNADEIKTIEFHLKQNQNSTAGMNARFYFQCEVREFTLLRQPASGNCRFLNFNLAVAAR